METQKTPVENLSFRQAMEELDATVRLLEGNTLELEQSLQTYERGIKLLAMLQGKLDDAEQRVSLLMGELVQKVDDETQDTQLS